MSSGATRLTPVSEGCVQPYGFTLALEGDAGSLGQRNAGAAQQPPGAFGQKNGVASLPSRRLDAGGHIDRVADHTELKPASGTDAAGYHRARIQAGAIGRFALQRTRPSESS